MKKAHVKRSFLTATSHQPPAYCQPPTAHSLLPNAHIIVKNLFATQNNFLYLRLQKNNLLIKPIKLN